MAGSYSLNIVYLWRDELFPFISNSKYRFKILLLFVKISFSIFFHASRKIWKINREETNTFIKEFQSFLRVKKNTSFKADEALERRPRRTIYRSRDHQLLSRGQTIRSFLRSAIHAEVKTFPLPWIRINLRSKVAAAKVKKDTFLGERRIPWSGTKDETRDTFTR